MTLFSPMADKLLMLFFLYLFALYSFLFGHYLTLLLRSEAEKALNEMKSQTENGKTGQAVWHRKPVARELWAVCRGMGMAAWQVVR